tara:strand:+ start:1097 stop:1486 length:390 start_codon:yes stop_codon:yes gene_type:complete
MKKKELLRDVKLIDIALVAMYYFTFSLIFITMLNKFFEVIFREEKYPIEKTSTLTLFIQTLIEIGTLAIVSFYLRHFIRAIPFIFDGRYGYHHTQTKEINGGVVITFALMTFFSDLRRRSYELSTRLKL